MKKFYLMALCAAVAAFAGCEQKIPVPAPEAEFLAYFGFEACEGVFPEAVRVDEPEASGVIEFTTPVGTDAEAYKALVPVFETTSPDAVVTDAEGNVIESGKPFDFSKEVDIYVTMTNEGGETSTMYTVSVKAKAALSWKLAAESAEETKGDPFMAVNPKNGLPYIATIVNNSTSSEQFGMAYKFDGELKPAVGTSPVFTNFRVGNIAIGFDGSGTPYAAYREYTDSGTGVSKLDGQAASQVGDPCAFKPYPGSLPAILPASSNSIWVAAQAGATVGDVTKRMMELAKWSGSAWEIVPSITNTRPADAYAYYNESVHADGNDYLFVFNQSNKASAQANVTTVSLYQVNENGWTTVAELLNIHKADGTPSSDTYLKYQDCDVAKNGDVYFCVGVQFTSDLYNAGVVRYRPSDGSQTLIGGETSINMAKCAVSFALDENDTPYIAFTDENDILNVQYIDNKTKTWSTPVALSAGAVGTPTIRFNESGDGYIAVSNSETKRVQIYSAN